MVTFLQPIYIKIISIINQSKETDELFRDLELRKNTVINIKFKNLLSYKRNKIYTINLI